jgi:hypothetical protein
MVMIFICSRISKSFLKILVHDCLICLLFKWVPFIFLSWFLAFLIFYSFLSILFFTVTIILGFLVSPEIILIDSSLLALLITNLSILEASKYYKLYNITSCIPFLRCNDPSKVHNAHSLLLGSPFWNCLFILFFVYEEQKLWHDHQF